MRIVLKPGLERVRLTAMSAVGSVSTGRSASHVASLLERGTPIQSAHLNKLVFGMLSELKIVVYGYAERLQAATGWS